jgi:hypothetical protein
MGSWGNDNEASCSIKDRSFLNYLGHYYILKMNSNSVILTTNQLRGAEYVGSHSRLKMCNILYSMFSDDLRNAEQFSNDAEILYTVTNTQKQNSALMSCIILSTED